MQRDDDEDVILSSRFSLMSSVSGSEVGSIFSVDSAVVSVPGYDLYARRGSW